MVIARGELAEFSRYESPGLFDVNTCKGGEGDVVVTRDRPRTTSRQLGDASRTEQLGMDRFGYVSETDGSK